MASSAAGKVLIYKSPNIFERRRRILQAARAMIAELGYENFSIRELARRAGVAQRTLYNAFGSKENIISTAIAEYQRDFDQHTVLQHPLDSLEGRLEQLVQVHTRNLQIRPYTTATMAIYNSQSAEPSIRARIRAIAFEHTWPYAEALAARRQLAHNITPAELTERATSFGYATLSDWCFGAIRDEELAARMAESLLTVLVACTRGQAAKDAQRWLAEVRDRGPGWREMLARVETPAIVRRTQRARARAGADPLARRAGSES